MPPRKQKIIRSGRKSRPQKPKSAKPASDSKTEKLVIKLKLNRNAYEDPQSPVYKPRKHYDAPDSKNAAEGENAEGNALPIVDEKVRRGGRQRVKPYQPDMVFGSEMDSLLTSSVAVGKVEDEDVRMGSSPPSMRRMRAVIRQDSPETVQGANSPPLPLTSSASADIYDILSTLQSSSDVQVDLPNMYASENKDVIKPYTGKLLTDLYIQCYKDRLWHFCDLIADTWIRALRTLNKRSQRCQNKEDLMWRKNKPLEKIFAEKKKGFKKDVFEFDLEVEDPELASDVTAVTAERLRDLFAHTQPKCGARLLWADAIALSGKQVEREIARQPGAWPEGLFLDVMCTSLRMVGRKLTLKIEEAYEGAWCGRYHEHVKHGLPCYRKLAWEQKEAESRDGDDDEKAEEAATPVQTRGEKRARQMMGADEQDDAKRVRFDSGADFRIEVLDRANSNDAEGESESEEEG